MNINNLPIGVFDSGVGGLTVLRSMRLNLPRESFLYLGDTARLPYGTKSPNTVKQYAAQMARILVERQIKALVIACNTATTAALKYLQQLMPNLPLVGVVQPGALAVVAATKNQRIAILATETTVASNAYQYYIYQQLPQAKINIRACSLLVTLAEEGMLDNSIAKEVVKHYISTIEQEDALLLGCTHFPVFRSLLTTMLPAKMAIVDSAQATAMALKQILTINNLHKQESSDSSNINYLVTDSVARFQRVGEIFLGEPLSAEQIELVDLK